MIFLFIIFLLITTSSFSQQFRLLRPVPDTIQTNGSYLYAEPNINNSNLGHRGLDILIRYDTVYSASSGVVHFVGYNPSDSSGGYEPGGAGNYIVIKSQWEQNTIYLYYMHLTIPLVNKNDTVSQGKPIAISGNTGNSTGPHLHFEIRMNTSDFSASKSRRNPELWAAISGMGAIYGHVPNAPNSTRVDISPDPKPRPPYTTFGWALTYNFNNPYIGSDDIYGENYAVGDVKPGIYTITALNGAYRRVVTVGAGEVVNADISTSIEGATLAVEEFILEQNYPNPFNTSTNISFHIAQSGFVNIKVFDIIGRVIVTLVNENKDAGKHEVNFDAAKLPSGVYFYKMQAGKFSATKKLMLLK